jgi:hypothetical protein
VKIYIESTIPSYLVARAARDLLQAARQQLTGEWWRVHRPLHENFVSQVVVEEIRRGDPEFSARRLAAIQDLEMLPNSDEALEFAEGILRKGILPSHADSDALHIAFATVSRMDILLSWNLRHITNVFIQKRLREFARSSPYSLPHICTPEGFDEYEEINQR